MCPRSSRFVTGRGGWAEDGRMVCHCLLIETADGLVLVDTGIGTADCDDPKGIALPLREVVRPRLRREETAIAQVEALGFSASDVRHVVQTHLDFDHASGLPDFPDAEVHVFAAELDAMRNPTFREKPRYTPRYFAHDPKWVRHEVEGDSWRGFESVRVLDGDAQVALIPMAGHSRGHCAVAVDAGDGWLLHAGDAYFHEDEMADPPSCPPGLLAFQAIVGLEHGTRRRNKKRLNEFVRDHGHEVTVFCAHDAAELERLRGAGG